MPRVRHLAFVLGMLALVPAILPTPVAAQDWHHDVRAGHPLVGKIWSSRDQRFVGLSSVLTAATGATYLLLGEKHDNRDHHRLQAMVTEAVYRSGRRPALAFEMIAKDKQPAIDAFLAENPENAGALDARVGWQKSGWGPWAVYRAIADAAVAADAPIIAANLPRSQNRPVSRQGYAVLGDDLVRRTGLDRPLPEEIQADLEAEIGDAHCGQIPATVVPAIARVQRARDAVMADRMAAAGRGAILITGAGHARLDRGVPYFLRILDPDAVVISIGFREVAAGAETIADYGDAANYDYLWFTPRVDDKDPCEQFKNQLKNMPKQPN